MDFDKELNISYVKEGLPKPSIEKVFEHYLSSLMVYGFVVLFLCYNAFGHSYIHPVVINIFKKAYFTYMFIAPVILVIFRPLSVYASHNVEIYGYFKKLFSGLKNIDLSTFENFRESLKYAKPDYYQKQSMMLIFIKAYFGSLMLTFLLNNAGNIIEQLGNYREMCLMLYNGLKINFHTFCGILLKESDFIYGALVQLLFSIDVLCFSIGYMTETCFLKNKVKTCEISFAGIFFCLICYPPFNNVLGAFTGFGQNDYNVAFSDPFCAATIILRLCALFSLTIYALSSIALGTKASNLTNRGIVSKFPYNIVRHPAYISKLSFWFFTAISVFFIPFSSIKNMPLQYCINIIMTVIAFLFIVFIYYMRALTEERHLLLDSDYQQYVQKVKYKFIPGIF